MTNNTTPSDDEIVEAIIGALDKSEPHTFESRARKIFAAIRPMILRQATQAAPASTMRSAEEIRAEIERIHQQRFMNAHDDTRVLTLSWVLKEQEPEK